MAKKEKQNKAKKKRWYTYLVEAYQISQKSYSWTPFAVFGPLVAGIVLGVVLGAVTHQWLLWVLTGVLLGITSAMFIISALVRRASYSQIDGMPGATAAVLGQIKRGWVFDQEPTRFNRSQDMIFRAVGRPGVVVLAEGPSNRVNQLVKDEVRAIKRVAPSAPIEVIKVGNEAGQVPLIKLERQLRRLPKRISNEEVTAVAQRLRAIQTSALPIPKGIDPFNTRPNRRAMRG
ncbi:MAG: DUF4191 domain-containing protein [Trueperella sp.]|nr:DUF4191 domain-containing protein [Trueperella sp.]